MAIRDGIYELVSGNGAARLVTVKDGKVDPYDQGGDVLGRLEVVGGGEGDTHGRMFCLSLTDPSPTIDETHIHHAGSSYRYRAVQSTLGIELKPA